MERYFIADLDIADNIVRLRKASGLTQKQVAVKLQTLGLNITRSRLSMIELKRLNIPVSVLVAMKRIFGCDYADFFQGLEESLPLDNL